MDREEIERLKEIERKSKERNKKQNNYIANKYDRISVVLPKGAKEKIKQLTGGASCNTFINVLVREKLEELERAASECKDFMNPPEEPEENRPPFM